MRILFFCPVCQGTFGSGLLKTWSRVKKRSPSTMWFQKIHCLFLSWHKIAAFRVVTHGGEQGMLEGCKQYHLSPLPDVPLPAHGAFLDLLQSEAWHFKVNEDQCQFVLWLLQNSKVHGRLWGEALPALGYMLSLLTTPHALRQTLVPNTKPSPSW